MWPSRAFCSEDAIDDAEKIRRLRRQAISTESVHRKTEQRLNAFCSAGFPGFSPRLAVIYHSAACNTILQGYNAIMRAIVPLDDEHILICGTSYANPHAVS